MNYFKTFYRICTGPAVFIELYQRSAWRAFWDLLLTCVFGALLYSVIQLGLTNALFQESAKRIDAEFGNLQVFKDAVLPTRQPETARTLLLSPAFSISYFPAPEGKMGAALPAKGLYGVILTPGGCWAWMRRSADTVSLAPVMSAEQWFEHMQQSASRQEIPLAELGKAVGSWPVPVTLPEGKTDGLVSVTSQLWLFQAMFGLFCFWLWLFALLIQVLLFGGLFVLVFGWFGSSRSSLTRKQLWVTMLYAGFPAMLVGTLVQGFELALSYNTVYVFGMIGYLLFVLARLERDLNPALRNQSGNRDSDDSDMDF